LIKMIMVLRCVDLDDIFGIFRSWWHFCVFRSSWHFCGVLMIFMFLGCVDLDGIFACWDRDDIFSCVDLDDVFGMCRSWWHTWGERDAIFVVYRSWWSFWAVSILMTFSVRGDLNDIFGCFVVDDMFWVCWSWRLLWRA